LENLINECKKLEIIIAGFIALALVSALMV